MKKVLFIGIGVLVVGIAIFFLVSNMTYSEGTRSGYLIKISNKGVLFKTYEGQLNLGGVNSSDGMDAIVQNKMWDFSVADEVVFLELQEYQGKYVTLAYREIYRSFPWQGDTEYFVTGVRDVK